MLELKKPPRLRPGDKVAAVSLSWGAAGRPDIRWRYELGKRRMQELFGLEVVEMPHTLAPEDYVAAHPEKRAEDLMAAFRDPAIRGIFGVIGGSDSIRMLPYLDFSVIAANPKVLTGYSDGTISDFIAMKAGLRSFYGAHVLNDFGEAGQMPPYTARMVRRMLFEPETACAVRSPGDLPWSEDKQPCRRQYVPDGGYRPLRGGVAEGTLIGGCFEVFPDVLDTVLLPPPEAFAGSILFYEVCGVPSAGKYREKMLLLAEYGFFTGITGLILGKPLGGREMEKVYDRVTLEVLDRLGLGSIPVLSNASFGHNSPGPPGRYPGPVRIAGNHGGITKKKKQRSRALRVRCFLSARKKPHLAKT